MWGQIAAAISFILEMWGKWETGNKKKIGFILKAIGSIAWLVTGLLTGVLGLILASSVGFGLNIRNYFKWKRSEDSV